MVQVLPQNFWGYIAPRQVYATKIKESKIRITDRGRLLYLIGSERKKYQVVRKKIQQQKNQVQRTSLYYRKRVSSITKKARALDKNKTKSSLTEMKKLAKQAKLMKTQSQLSRERNVKQLRNFEKKLVILTRNIENIDYELVKRLPR